LALEHGSDDLPLRFKLWFGKAFDLAGAIAELTASTLARGRQSLRGHPRNNRLKQSAPTAKRRPIRQKGAG
jgi:hypothetical protein